VVEGARLESVYTFIAYRGFESPSVRQIANKYEGSTPLMGDGLSLNTVNQAVPTAVSQDSDAVISKASEPKALRAANSSLVQRSIHLPLVSIETAKWLPDRVRL